MNDTIRITKTIANEFILRLGTTAKQGVTGLIVVQKRQIILDYAMLKEDTAVVKPAEENFQYITYGSIGFAVFLAADIDFGGQLIDPVEKAAKWNHQTEIFDPACLRADWVDRINSVDLRLLRAQITVEPISVISGFVLAFADEPEVWPDSAVHKRRNKRKQEQKDMADVA